MGGGEGSHLQNAGDDGCRMDDDRQRAAAQSGDGPGVSSMVSMSMLPCWMADGSAHRRIGTSAYARHKALSPPLAGHAEAQAIALLSPARPSCRPADMVPCWAEAFWPPTDGQPIWRSLWTAAAHRPGCDPAWLGCKEPCPSWLPGLRPQRGDDWLPGGCLVSHDKLGSAVLWVSSGDGRLVGFVWGLATSQWPASQCVVMRWLPDGCARVLGERAVEALGDGDGDGDGGAECRCWAVRAGQGV
ncbi:uncharacterized protein BJ171DRAFT_631200 [Polychytrium aggregatum]|uniref:uncharacterized protein n=1 Tax=Polychytrium aggregatum TaxID=110093 RepID=UPI0022FF06D1|nr:uncharacterized protein BJ171DRAFT_631200 [Polychytrium aggregatum]KAI9208575.1 hypothetical protein BJ171DRAFT_631200 [Polychytrium aggregatum]